MKKATKYLAALVLSLFFFTLLLPLFSSAIEDPEVDEKICALLYHNDSGTVLYHNDTGAYLPAGPAARLMAGLIFAEKYEGKMNKTVTVNKRVTGLASSTMNPGLKSGETISVYELLCGALIANSDDAVFALAFDLYDDNADAPTLFLREMNRKAEQLGMVGTCFYDLVGAEPKNADESYSYSCLDDLLKLALAADGNETVRSICAIPDHTVPATNKSGERRLLTRNYLLSALRIPGYTYKDAVGLAAGYGKTAGSTVLATAEIDGKRYTCIVMNVPEDNGAFPVAKTLFTWGNANFSYKTVLEESRIMGEIEIALSGDSDYITVSPEKKLTAFLPNDVNISEEVLVSSKMDYDKLTAPVREGLIAGEVTVSYKGRELARTNLVTTGSLSLSNSRYYLSLFLNFVKSPIFLYSCIGLLVLAAAYVLINARVRYLRKNRPASLVFYEEDGLETNRPETEERDEGKAEEPAGLFELIKTRNAKRKQKSAKDKEDGTKEQLTGITEKSVLAEESKEEEKEQEEEEDLEEIFAQALAEKEQNAEGKAAKETEKPEKTEDTAVQSEEGKKLFESLVSEEEDEGNVQLTLTEQDFPEEKEEPQVVRRFYDAAKDEFTEDTAENESVPDRRTDYVPEGWGKKN